MTKVRFLALGDSYTIGEGVAPGQRWPAQLAQRLRGRLLQRRAPAERLSEVVEPEIIAATGWTTGELAAGIGRARPEGPYGLVSLLIGVNNQFRGLPLDAYREEFAALLSRAMAFAGGDARRVIVLSIPDWGVTPFAAGRDGARIACEIDAFNQGAREITVRAGAAFVDITPITRRAADDLSLLADDGLHPSGAMYALWVEALLPVVTGAIET